MLAAVKALCKDALHTAYPDLTHLPLIVANSPPSQNAHAAYQLNTPLTAFGHLKKNKLPMPDGVNSAIDIANKLAAVLLEANQAGPHAGMLADAKVYGAGFVTLELSPAYLAAHIKRIVREGKITAPAAEPTRVIVDFSSPNVAKEMHVGHLRSTIIGDTICRILEFVGHDVLRVNHVGDWGTQFGMLIAHLKDVFPKFASEPPPIGDLQNFYREAKKVMDEDEAFKARAHAEVVRLQSGDGASRQAWQQICDVSRREFEKVYSRLGVRLEEVGESFYNEFIPGVIGHLDEVGSVSEAEGGAKVIFPPGTRHEQPLIIRKSDGGFGYDSTDMAAVWYRLLVKGAGWLIYVTDAGQAPHFELVFAAARQAGWVDRGQRLDHTPFGVVCGTDGKKFKTRSGEVTRLVDLLDEAVARMEAELRTREEAKPAEERVWTEEDIVTTARQMGYAAVKYADLKGNREKDYVFSFDRMLDPRGNTSVYLHYAGARLASILRKCSVDLGSLYASPDALVVIAEPTELQLAFQIARFDEVLDLTLENIMPNTLADYLYNLCTTLSKFYVECKVLNSPEQSSRLQLVRATQIVIMQVMDLLGIGYVERL